MTLRDDKTLLPPPEPTNHPANQLPAYSETDGSDSGYEHINTPRSVDEQPTSYMTAEQEKAYLASREQHEAPRSFDPENPPSPTSNSLTRGLQVPTCNARVSSGFPYPDMLAGYGVSHQQWSDFTSEITRAAHLTNKDWAIAVGSGLGTVLASSLLVGWLGLVFGAVVGEKVRQSAEHKNLRAAMGDLESQLLRWNETVFRPQGFLVRLELPGESSAELHEMDVYRRKTSGCCGRRAANRTANTAGKKGDWWARRAQRKEEWQKKKAIKRGRIVILPLDMARSSQTAPLDPSQLLITEKQPYPEVKEL